MAQTQRNVILLSHANPEDNQATVWFATQLANEGYQVWSDVLCLGGGEDFWGDIENVIRLHAAKVVFLLSPIANRKDGCLRELNLAQTVARRESLTDFVIPLRISDMPHADVNIRLNSVNILDSLSWGVGLAALLKKLQDDAVPRQQAKDFRATSTWWKGRFATSLSVLHESEVLASNWFAVRNPNLKVYWHRIGCSQLGPVIAPPNLPSICYEDSGGIWTFSPADTLKQYLPPTYEIDRTVGKDISAGSATGKAERNAAYRLLNMAWQAQLQKLGLLRHELANGKQCFAFPDGLIEGNEISFQSHSGRKGRRGVVGFKTRTNAQGESWLRHWHFAIEPIPGFLPGPMTMIRTHVLFSEDGKTLWTNANRLLRARRDQCRNWWNDAWRDRVLAVMSWLANGEDVIRLDVGPTEPISIEREPLEFVSTVSYVPPQKVSANSDDAETTAAAEGDDAEDDDADDDDLLDGDI